MDNINCDLCWKLSLLNVNIGRFYNYILKKTSDEIVQLSL